MTAAALYAALVAAGCRLRVDAGELVIAPPPPPELERYLAVLTTGVWAVAAGRRWYGTHRDTGRPCGPCPLDRAGPLAYGALDPHRLLPRDVGLLLVESEDGAVDRIPGESAEEIPEVFEPAVAARPPLTPAASSAQTLAFDVAG
jgi:hypothetical protein